ncbi:MAG: ATP phosphoribosyltransferase regulatory subunit [Chloroflexota bacterium]
MLDQNPPQRPAAAQIPAGVSDYFWTDAWQRRKIQQSLLSTFRRWGYDDVIPPSFEYADTIGERASAAIRSNMYRFLDRDGRMLALRADMTIPVARLVGTRLYDRPMPQRFCYAGSIFRHVEQIQANTRREFWQAGSELIGAAGPDADAEILAMSAHALQAIGLSQFQLVMGHFSYYTGLLKALNVSPEQETLLTTGLIRNSQAAIREFLNNTSLGTQQRETVEGLLHLKGYDANVVIAEADRLCLNGMMHNALVNLHAIYDVLKKYNVASYVYLDLTTIRDLGYYTGLNFEIFAPKMGAPVGSGGRYDTLLSSFGLDLPAIGTAFGMDRLIMALHAQNNESVSSAPIPVDAWVYAGGSSDCLDIVQAWRAQGLRIVVDVSGYQRAQLWQAAQEAGAKCALSWREGDQSSDNQAGFEAYMRRDSATSTQFLSATNAVEGLGKLLGGEA